MLATVEGRGIVSPKAMEYPITDEWRRCVEGESKRRADRDAKHRDKWKKGVISNAHEVGMLGELAAAEYLGATVDYSHQHDAGSDLVVNGVHIQVKSTIRKKMPLVKQQRRKKAHVFVFCEVGSESVKLLGWVPYERVVSRGLVDSVGVWKNYQPLELPELNSMSDWKASAAGNLIRYPGGKSRLWNELSIHLPRGDMYDPKTYVEPFVGGGAIYRRVLLGDFRRFVINDVDLSLVELWRAVKDDSAALCRAVIRWQPSVDDWFAAKSLDGDLVGSRVDVALRKLILHFCSHGGLGYMAGGPQGGVSQDSEYPIGCRWNPISLVKRIRWFSERMQTTELYNCDFTELPIDDDSFVFCDPPYVSAGDQLYRYSFTATDHERLNSWLSKLPTHWAVTYDNHEKVRKLYERYRILEYDNDTGNNRKHTELLITNQ